MLNRFDSEVFYKEQIDLSFADKEKDLLIIDKSIVPFFNSHIASWKYIYPVEAGETLKEFSTACKHIEALFALWGATTHRQSRIIVCGGGSVGDFGGFFASVLKRGTQLIHIPTTWLSAIDSAHGGKTGLNLGGFKNQLGTFYPADQIFIFKEILLKQGRDRARDGFGETYKIFLLEDEQQLENLFASSFESVEDLLWKTLKTVVAKKYQIVLQDPYELLGLRKVLNLGHTLGHALEASTKSSHGTCVLQGLIFSLRWSLQKGHINSNFLNKSILFIKKYDIPIWEQSEKQYKFMEQELKNLAIADKKSFGKNELDFVFVKNAGKVFCERVNIDDFISEAKRQGWVNTNG
jgi:3-dehydroquinate synthase